MCSRVLWFPNPQRSSLLPRSSGKSTPPSLCDNDFRAHSLLEVRFARYIGFPHHHHKTAPTHPAAASTVLMSVNPDPTVIVRLPMLAFSLSRRAAKSHSYFRVISLTKLPNSWMCKL